MSLSGDKPADNIDALNTTSRYLDVFLFDSLHFINNLSVM